MKRIIVAMGFAAWVMTFLWLFFVGRGIWYWAIRQHEVGTGTFALGLTVAVVCGAVAVATEGKV
jgi:hypothetical protein